MPINDILYNVEIYRGSLFPLTITLTDDNDVAVSLTGYAVYCEIRTQPGGELLATPSVVITPASGLIYICLTPAQTKEFGAAKGVIDVLLVEIADLTNVRPILRGDVAVFPQITAITKTLSGTTVSGAKTITGLVATGALVIGMAITGTGIGAGSVIATIDSPTQVTGTVNSTASATVSVTFSL